MRLFLKLIVLWLLFCFQKGVTQNVTPSVLGTAGATYTLTNENGYSDNIGEVFTVPLTFSTQLLSQGFLQPEIQSGGVFNVSFSSLITQLSCNKNDGIINLNVTTSGAKNIYYVWTPSNVCPDSSCSSIDSLKPGNYQVSVKGRFSRPPKADTIVVVTSSVMTIYDNSNPCKIGIYNAVTMNNDNLNDFFYIENIEEFPENKVSIYNRYGVLMKEISGYNNKDKIWPDNDSNTINGTYFYIIRLSEKDNLIKGWVELMKN